MAGYNCFDNYIAKHKKRKIYNCVLSVLICITVFLTFYLLIQPSLTWSRYLVCELEEHRHSDSCYETVTVPEAVELVCAKEEHIHDDSCYHEVKTLVCGLEENGEHEHTEDCYAVSSVLECSKEEHTHSEACYLRTEEHTERVLACGKKEHTHSDSCFDAPSSAESGYSCGKVAHKHTEDCYSSDGTLLCTLEEHEHSDACLGVVMLRSSVTGSGIFTSSDLGDFVTEYMLYDRDGVPVTDGPVYVGESYTIRVFFSESNTFGSNRQFMADDDGYLTYQFDTTHLRLTPTGPKPLKTAGITVGQYWIDENGKLFVAYDHVDNTGAPCSKLFFDNYQNTDLYIDFTAYVGSNDESGRLHIDLQNDVVIEMEAPEVGTLEVTKSQSQFQQTTHSMEYSVIVKCGHGIISDLALSDTALLSDNSTTPPVQYDLSSGMFSYSDFTVTDLDGNPVTDGSGDPVTDIASLNGATLHGGDGYILHYSINLDPAFYDAHPQFKASLYNEFSADGTDPDNNTVTASDEKNATLFDINNMNKNGTLAGDITIDGTTYQLIRWTVSVGDYTVIQSSPLTLTDILGQAEQHYYFNAEDTAHKATWQIASPSDVTPNNGTFTLNDNVTVDSSGDTESASFTLPAGGSRYSITYYTYVPRPDSGSVVINNSADISWGSGMDDWEVGSNEINVIGIGDTPTIDKDIVEVDDEYIYYRVEAVVPENQYGNHVYIQDELRPENGKKILNDAEILSVTVEDLTTNETETLSPYSGSGPTEGTFKYYKASDTGNDQRSFFSITFTTSTYQNGPSKWQVSSWPYENPVKLTMTYRVSRSLPEMKNGSPTGRTIDDCLAEGSRLKNTAAVYYGPQGTWTSLEDYVYYNEMVPVGKTGSVTNQSSGIISYKAAFTNDQLPPGETDYRNKEAMLTDDFYNGYFYDAFDPRLEYVNGSLYAFLYQRNTSADKNLLTTFGQNQTPVAVFKYTGSNITDTEISALWRDFTAFDLSAAGFTVSSGGATYSGNGTVRYSYHDYENMEQLLQAYPDRFGLVFAYDMTVRPQYRSTLSDTASELHLRNAASFGWELPSGSRTTGGASVTVDYSTEILTKEHTPDTPDITLDDPIHYTITVNPYGYDLTDGHSVVLEDTMCSSLKLMLSTVTVEEGTIDETTGETIWSPYTGDPQIAFDPGNNRLSFVIPDDRPVRIKYDCKIDSTAETVTLTNSVAIDGFAEVVNKDLASYQVHSSSTATSGANEKMYLKKLDSVTHLGLSNAVFAFYGNNSALQYEAPEETAQTLIASDNAETLYYYGQYTTESHAGALDGSVEILDMGTLEYHGHYAIMELQAPTGYVLDPTIHEFYWGEPPTGSSDEIPVIRDGDTLYIENTLIRYYELPATGGPGTLPFLSAGVSLLLLSVLVFLNRKRKKPRDSETSLQ